MVNLRRNPMDACYAMYKTLFRMAYPFSYDLDDLGRYWLGHERLMAPWRRVLPADRLLELASAALVPAPEAHSRRLVAHPGRAWDEACLRFEPTPPPHPTTPPAQRR